MIIKLLPILKKSLDNENYQFNSSLDNESYEFLNRVSELLKILAEN